MGSASGQSKREIGEGTRAKEGERTITGTSLFKDLLYRLDRQVEPKRPIRKFRKSIRRVEAFRSVGETLHHEPRSCYQLFWELLADRT
jgi:hypothetical protein